MRLLDRSLLSPTRPTVCPFCQSRAVGTLAKVIDADTYWRCSKCGTGWTTPRPGEQAVRGQR
jgi:ribosomal protein L37AE/L43A